jgi:hypothetical protein
MVFTGCSRVPPWCLTCAAVPTTPLDVPLPMQTRCTAARMASSFITYSLTSASRLAGRVHAEERPMSGYWRACSARMSQCGPSPRLHT